MREKISGGRSPVPPLSFSLCPTLPASPRLDDPLEEQEGQIPCVLMICQILRAKFNFSICGLPNLFLC